MLGSRINHSMIPQHVNLTHAMPDDYQLTFESIKSFQGGRFDELGLEACNIQDELDKVSSKLILSGWQRV